MFAPDFHMSIYNRDKCVPNRDVCVPRIMAPVLIVFLSGYIIAILIYLLFLVLNIFLYILLKYRSITFIDVSVDLNNVSFKNNFVFLIQFV